MLQCEMHETQSTSTTSLAFAVCALRPSIWNWGIFLEQSLITVYMVLLMASNTLGLRRGLQFSSPVLPTSSTNCMYESSSEWYGYLVLHL